MLVSSVYTKSGIFQLLVPSQQEGWRGTRSWEGTQPGQLTQTGQRHIPYHMTSCPVYKLGGVGWEGQITAQELIGHRSASGKQLHCASLVLCSLILLALLLSLFFLPFCPIKLSLAQPTSFTFFQFSPPSHWAGGVSEQLRGA